MLLSTRSLRKDPALQRKAARQIQLTRKRERGETAVSLVETGRRQAAKKRYSGKVRLQKDER